MEEIREKKKKKGKKMRDKRAASFYPFSDLSPDVFRARYASRAPSIPGQRFGPRSYRKTGKRWRDREVRHGRAFFSEVSFEGFPNQLLDWTLTAQTGPLNSSVVEGRQILSEEPALAIQRSIELTEDKFVMASR